MLFIAPKCPFLATSCFLCESLDWFSGGCVRESRMINNRACVSPHCCGQWHTWHVYRETQPGRTELNTACSLCQSRRQICSCWLTAGVGRLQSVHMYAWVWQHSTPQIEWQIQQAVKQPCSPNHVVYSDRSLVYWEIVPLKVIIIIPIIIMWSHS